MRRKKPLVAPAPVHAPSASRASPSPSCCRASSASCGRPCGRSAQPCGRTRTASQLVERKERRALVRNPAQRGDTRSSVRAWRRLRPGVAQREPILTIALQQVHNLRRLRRALASATRGIFAAALDAAPMAQRCAACKRTQQPSSTVPRTSPNIASQEREDTRLEPLQARFADQGGHVRQPRAGRRLAQRHRRWLDDGNAGGGFRRLHADRHSATKAHGTAHRQLSAACGRCRPMRGGARGPLERGSRLATPVHHALSTYTSATAQARRCAWRWQEQNARVVRQTKNQAPLPGGVTASETPQR